MAYDTMSNIVAIIDEDQFGTTTKSYGYDALYRLLNATETRLAAGACAWLHSSCVL